MSSKLDFDKPFTKTKNAGLIDDPLQLLSLPSSSSISPAIELSANNHQYLSIERFSSFINFYLK